ncbi:hypothetical protein CLV51_102827 [Chitinophaga niastensis]|uniref:DUF4397 domain-containing protein n=1 Tax=Chitinophaga niastensis TaxID=536980 RepID=A0A2P8HP59_CHINA|nr:hypothetical protein [Chitinophaga niastensis]PSL47967.1 hypothetical protein CLV51_102827 [Chitinophaga niastensis]
MKKYIILHFLCLLTIAMTSCKKYAEAPLLSHPAYLRVFNDMAYSVDFLHNGQGVPFLTFIMDPHTDAAGVADTGAIVGDFLGTRQLFSLSYPINEANSSSGQTTNDGRGGVVNLNPVNFEYPGNAHVLTAPAINGFDLSAWAQVPAGKHRILFVNRPQNNTSFPNLSATIRSNVLLDTTVNFEEGEVYTMEVVARDLDNNKYGLYLRREAFVHQSFEENKIYAGFVNLSGVQPRSSQYHFKPAFSDNVSIYYTYNIYDDIASDFKPLDPSYNPLPGYNNIYYTTLQTKMDTVIPYLALPMLPRNYFFRQDTLRTYLDKSVVLIGGGATRYGSMPHVRFDLADAANVGPTFPLICAGDPTIFNNYNVNTTYIKKFTPNLNLVVNTGNALHIYSTLNIMEMVYDRVYLMQIQRGFNEVPKN